MAVRAFFGDADFLSCSMWQKGQGICLFSKVLSPVCRSSSPFQMTHCLILSPLGVRIQQVNALEGGRERGDTFQILKNPQIISYLLGDKTHPHTYIHFSERSRCHIAGMFLLFSSNESSKIWELIYVSGCGSVTMTKRHATHTKHKCSLHKQWAYCIIPTTLSDTSYIRPLIPLSFHTTAL